MKKFFLLTIFIFTSTLSFANDAQNNPIIQTGRGMSRIATSPLEISKSIDAYWKEGATKTKHTSVWIFCGAVKGVVNMVGNIFIGVSDIVTAPIAGHSQTSSLTAKQE